MSPLSAIMLVLVLSLNRPYSEAADGCVGRNYGWGSVVCVCNSTYCDDIGDVDSVPYGNVLVYTSTKSGLRFFKQTKKIGSCKPKENGANWRSAVAKFNIDVGNLRQTIFGFGGTFTDATGININRLSENTKNKLIASYFGPTGIEYTLGRIPIASTDFSPRPYSYQNESNASFKLVKEDFVDKIPLIHIANSISRREIRYFAAPWSSPPWMRNENDHISPNFYQQWADYFANFISAYKANNVTIWAVSSQNEPFFPTYVSFDALSIFKIINEFSPLELKTFVTKNLRPTLKSTHPEVKLMAFDDNAPFIPFWQFHMNSNFCDSFDGTAFHWYFNKFIDYNVTLSDLHKLCPNNFILSTEACVGVFEKPPVKLGSWENAELYAHDIIKDLQNWVTGWVDWNMALDPTGGPNWINNFVDSPIIVNTTEDVFMKQPMYYALGHFSKFIPPGFRIANIPARNVDEEIEVLAALKPKNATLKDFNYDVAVVILNKGNASKSVELQTLGSQNSTICIEIPARAIQTCVWKITKSTR